MSTKYPQSLRMGSLYIYNIYICLVIVGSALREEQRRLRDLETQRYNLDNRLMELPKESAMSKVRGEGDD